jgi:serine/threonine-protein kinase
MVDPTLAAAAATADSRPTLTLGTRIFLATGLLMVLAMGSAVLITWILGNRVGQQAAREALERSSAVQQRFQDANFEQLVAAADRMAGDSNFAAYVAEAIDVGDVDSLLDILGAHRDQLGFDFAILLDPDGLLVARTDTPTAREDRGEDFSGEILFQLAEEGYAPAGVWERNARIYQAAAVPVATGSLLHGYLIIAFAIDDRAADELLDFNNTEVIYLLGDAANLRAAAGTLRPGQSEELITFLGDHYNFLKLAADSQEQFPVQLEQQNWLALVRPLMNVGEVRIGAVVNLVSLDHQLEPFKVIGRILGAVGVLAMLLALVVSYLLPKRVLQPMRRLAEAARQAAEGDYDQQIEIQRNDEVGQLASAFSTLLSELREKRDMEIYVAELARNVPDPESAATEAQPANTRHVMLLGVEMRHYVSTLDLTQSPRQTLDRLTRDLRRLSHAVQVQGGKTEAVLGHRLVASFSGERQADQALSAAAEIALCCRTADGLPTAAIAVVAGETITGTITWDNRLDYGMTGDPVESLEGLLRVATEGSLLLSKAAHARMSETLTQAGVQTQEYRSTVSTEPLYSLNTESTARFATPDHSATQKMEQLTTATSTGARTLSGIGPGSLLGQRFEILSELGAGGMGVVYKARDRSLNELVAVKMLKGAMWGEEQLEQLKEELRLARKISHPNILRTFDFGEAGGHPFISMEYVRGITLKQLLENSGRLPLSAGLRTARQLCRGLMAAHAQGILHRDIKPENIIIEPSGNVKLMDFGIARPMQRGGTAQTEKGAIVGTPFYLAPEQLEGEEPDVRADLYSCGVVLYEIFTGKLPFSIKGNIFEIINRKLLEEPTPPKEYWATMPDTLETIILRCMERDRDQRYGNVATLLEELDVMRA